jgi:DNA-binding NtrC family response regulator
VTVEAQSSRATPTDDGARVRVLILDDEALVATALARMLGGRFEVVTTDRPQEALRRLESEFFHVMLLDVLMPDMTGWDVLDRAQRLHDPPAIIVMTGQPELSGAVAAIRRGAADYVAKPVDGQDLVLRIERALATLTMRRRLSALEAGEDERTPIAESAAMQRVLALAERIAATPNSSALILGESGVGKEVVASRIHALSDRRTGPFVRVNLAAIPDTMIEAELFGSVRGAFTDAKRDRLGFFASADGGTLLLDELCEFRVDMQAKLLRVIEERRFFPVGSDRERRVNVRILAATNRDPEEAIRRGQLRSDLYYRLSTVTIQVPALRDRRDDVLPLARHFLQRYAAEFGRAPLHLGAEAEQALVAHAWPGNVRELRNAIERAAMVATGGVITGADLALPQPRSPSPPASALPPLPADAPLRLDEFREQMIEALEARHIARVLALAGGSRTKAAALLGISRTTLWEKLKKLGLPSAG